MIRIQQIKVPVSATAEDLKNAAAKVIRVNPSDITGFSIFRKSIDSRDKEDVRFVYTLDVSVNGNEKRIIKRCNKNRVSESTFYKYEPVENRRNSPFRPVIVGFGPAGMFSALILAEAGLNPIIFERGHDVDMRTEDVMTFWTTGKLNTDSNVQFGEGGAGTFSDGKLTTGIKDRRQEKVYRDFVKYGAPEDIAYSNYPHIGTDRLKTVVKNIREEVIRLGGEIHFGCTVTELIIVNHFIHGVTVKDESGSVTDIETDTVILAPGHSARDTYEYLYGKGITLMQKPFSVGTRIEHPREFIDRAQYGPFAGNPALGAANYKMACHPPNGRGAYTFCMCPGGTVVNASSEENRLCVNGMSEWARDKENSNSAILVGINPEHFPTSHPLSGMHLQREIESKAFIAGGSTYAAPAQLLGDFLRDTPSRKMGSVNPSCPTGVEPSDIRTVLPKQVTDTMAPAILKMDKMLNGFALEDAVLTAPEARSSAPVRILRDDYYEAMQGETPVGGLYPCGEGAGYAGGIVSAGVDGIRVAEAVLTDEHSFEPV